MKIKIWRRARLIWCWRCPICRRTWRNRQPISSLRSVKPSRLRSPRANEMSAMSAWERCMSGAHAHIKKYHGATIQLTITE